MLELFTYFSLQSLIYLWCLLKSLRLTYLLHYSAEIDLIITHTEVDFLESCKILDNASTKISFIWSLVVLWMNLEHLEAAQ
jgi:hypothetical protein